MKTYSLIEERLTKKIDQSESSEEFLCILLALPPDHMATE